MLLCRRTVRSTFMSAAWVRWSRPMVAPPSPIITMFFIRASPRRPSASTAPVATAVERPWMGWAVDGGDRVKGREGRVHEADAADVAGEDDVPGFEAQAHERLVQAPGDES